MSATAAAVLNAEPGAWAFADVADRLAAALGVDVVEQPAAWNYRFYAPPGLPARSFVPAEAVRVASDKRVQAELFAAAGLPTPTTLLAVDIAEARALARHAGRWALKYPTACGAAGHRPLTEETVLPAGWPLPLIVQEFVTMPRPEVYRLYGVGGELFGWNRRRYPERVADPSPWVAHATGAEYELLGEPPPDAATAAAAALRVTGSAGSFGCVDLISSDRGWLVLEVETDGPDSHVDRGVPEPLASEIDQRIARAFWRWVSASTQPPTRPRQLS